MAAVALIVSAILVFYLGILPTRVLDWAVASIGTISLTSNRRCGFPGWCPRTRPSDSGRLARSGEGPA